MSFEHLLMIFGAGEIGTAYLLLKPNGELIVLHKNTNTIRIIPPLAG